MDEFSLEIPLRDIKYDIKIFDVHGSSYRNMGTDPELKANTDGLILIHESKAIHTAAFRITNRKLNVIEAYGGLEELSKGIDYADLSKDASTSMGNLFFPQARGVGGTQLPILIPIARIRIQKALVAINTFRGTKPPKISTVEAIENSVEFFIDWEMSHKNHKLLFDTPGYHLGIQGKWEATKKELPQVGAAGAAFRLEEDYHDIFIRALKLVMKFDQDFVKVALHRCLNNYKKNFYDQAQLLYQEIDGNQWFGYEFNVSGFQQAMKMIGERVQSQSGLQAYYRLK